MVPTRQESPEVLFSRYSGTVSLLRSHWLESSLFRRLEVGGWEIHMTRCSRSQEYRHGNSANWPVFSGSVGTGQRRDSARALAIWGQGTLPVLPTVPPSPHAARER